MTILALQQIFSRFGKVDKIVMFDKGSGFQALVQMADVYTAVNAHEAADMQVGKIPRFCWKLKNEKGVNKPLQVLVQRHLHAHSPETKPRNISNLRCSDMLLSIGLCSVW